MSDKRPEYLQLEAGDDFNSIRDRLSFIRGKRVLIIWPEQGTAITRKLDLVLVQREARRRAVQLALVTHDEDVIQNAQDLGISVFETIGASERGRWKRGRPRVFIQRYHRPEDSPEPAQLMDVASRVRNQRKRISGLRFLFERIIILSILAALAGTGIFFILPTATIRLTVYSETMQLETTIIADPNISDIDVDQSLIPATILRATVQTVGNMNTSGMARLDDLPAIGIVVFTNQTVRVVDIPADTTVATSAGTPILFRTIAPVRLAGGVGSRAEVAVEALPGFRGTLGNLDAGLINTIVGPLEESVDVVNLSPTTGGENRSFAAVAAEDRDRLMAIVRGQLQAAAYEQFQASLSDSQLIVIETIRIPDDGARNDWINFSHEVGETTETLSLDMRSIVEAIAIDDRFARQIIFASLSSQKPRDLALVTDSFTYQRGGVISIDGDDRVTFSASATAELTTELNIEQIQQAILGLSPQEASAYIAQNVRLSPGTQVEISLNPDWATRVPLLPVRIQFETDSQS